MGNFETTLKTGGSLKTVQHGVTVVATGGNAADTDEYLYGKNDRDMRWHDLEHNLDKVKADDTVVFIQCVGSRDDERPYCSRICCTNSMLQAIAVKETHPDADVFILYRDIRTFGERELHYRKARELGVVFVRYSLDNKPVVTESADGLEVTLFDPILQRNVAISADWINLTTAIVPADTEQ